VSDQLREDVCVHHGGQPSQPGPRRNLEGVWQFLERGSEPIAVAARWRWDDCRGCTKGHGDTLIGRFRARAGSGTPVAPTRNRGKGIWPDPVKRPASPPAMLILSRLWLGSCKATAELRLPSGAPSPLCRTVDHAYS
jgi:hypothetical protein